MTYSLKLLILPFFYTWLSIVYDCYESVRETADRQSVIAFLIVAARYECVCSNHVNVLLDDGHSDDRLWLANSRDAIPQACLFIILRDKRTV